MAFHQGARRVVTVATKLYSVDAEPLLVKIDDPEIALLARIEMAQLLLGRSPSNGSRASTAAASSMRLRLAREEDIPALRALIDASVRTLQAGDYSAEQLDGALGTVLESTPN